jgi:hypothetical protein
MSDKQARSMDTNELHNETAIKEVQQLLKNGTVDLNPEIINRLRAKYSDDSVVDSVMEYFTDRRSKIVKVASIFMEAFERKYKNDFHTMSLSKFMKRCLKYKKRYELSDEEFDEIRRIFEMRLFNSNANLGTTNVVYPNTTLSRAFGYAVVESTEPIKPSNTDDYSYLQEIIRTYQVYKGIHSYVVIQTMLYQDLADEAMNGTFDRSKHDVNRYVHPLLAAFFLPKIESVEERMLYANIAGIINTRYNRERIVTKPDYELFYSMVVDPADTVCDNSSPMRDIKSRAEVQVQLWNNVYNLRNGKYYDATSLDFVAYIDKCKVSNVDNPDVLYLSDEGVILRRLFAVFSFRPIIVSTQPVFGMVTNNPFNLPVNPSVITSIPYITYKLPQIAVQGQNYALSDANNQIQFYMENGTFVPKATQILDCRGPIVFYVPRRSIALPINFANPQLSPFGFASLDVSTRHYHNINGIEIDYDQTMNLNVHITNTQKTFYLRSVVVLEKWQNSNVVLGHMAYLFKYARDADNNIISARPTETTVYVPRKANLTNSRNFPIFVASDMNAKMAISTCGTVFVYADK